MIPPLLPEQTTLRFGLVPGTIRPIMGSDYHSSLSSYLLGKTRSAVLALLFCNSDRSFHFREIVRTLETGPGAIQRELAGLVRAGLVIKRRVGNQTHYHADATSSIFTELKSLLVKTAGLMEPLRRSLSSLAGKVSIAFVYGSFARGADTANSDVDVIAIGDATFPEISLALDEAQDYLGREVNPSVFPVDEFVEKISAGNHFLNQLIDAPKLFIIGNEDEFRRLVRKRVA